MARYVKVEGDRVLAISSTLRDGFIDLGQDIDVTGASAVLYDAATNTISSDPAAAKLALEPRLLELKRKSDDANALGLGCAADCQAQYDALLAEWSAL